MKIDGHCHYGRISFEAAIPTQSSSATASTAKRLPLRPFVQTSPLVVHFVFRSGTPKSYMKTAESGNKRRHAFCGDCGTTIYACAGDNPQSYSLRVGTIRCAPPSRQSAEPGGVPRWVG